MPHTSCPSFTPISCETLAATLMAATRLGCVQPTCKKQQKNIDSLKNVKHVDTSFLKSFRQNLWLSLEVI